MSLICLEGLDKTGKSTIAALYADLGYATIHMSAPDKKFNDPKYIGATYFDEMEKYTKIFLVMLYLIALSTVKLFGQEFTNVAHNF